MFPEILSKLLKEKRISQSELASDLNTHRQNVYQWVSGKTVPRNEMLMRLASYFEVSVDYLLGKEKPKFTNSKTQNIKQSQKKSLAKSQKSAKSLKEIFSENLKYYRKQSGFTQDDFAKAVGTDPVYISYIENAKRFPSIEYIEKMSKILEIESYKLFLPSQLETNELSKEVLYNKLKENLINAVDMVFEQY